MTPLETPDVLLEEPPATPVTRSSASDSKVCSQCGAPQGRDGLAVCRKCGYHQRLGLRLELDPLDQEDDGAPSAQTSHLQVWLTLVPAYVWLLLGCMLVVVAESVAARMLTVDGGPARTTWSLTQLGVGVCLLFLSHVLAYTLAITDNDQLKVLDLVLRPLYCWMPTLRGLPRRFALAATALCSLTAAAMSLLVIGGIPYERLWDWGLEPPPKQNLLGAIADRAQQIKDRDQSLEEAVGDFAGKAGVEGEEEAKPAAPVPRKTTQCLILGYLPDPQNPHDFKALVLASEVRGVLREVAIVSDGFDVETRERLNRRMRQITRPKPFIDSLAPAHWLAPLLTCEVSYVEQMPAGRLTDPRFIKLLADLGAN